nr:MAG TPA: Head Tail Connector Protein [Caudoviricetes sp.]DAY08855.1 MAG TPA: Head Tail Connector Protein [Caudoviricetes sp.]
MIDVSETLLKQFKDKLHILHDDDDDNLKRLLSFSYSVLCEKCGFFDIENNEQGKSLVFERARYEYNDKLEYFDINFLGEISSLLIRLEKERRTETSED